MSLRRWLYLHAFWLYRLADDYPLNLEIDRAVDEIDGILQKYGEKEEAHTSNE